MKNQELRAIQIMHTKIAMITWASYDKSRAQCFVVSKVPLHTFDGELSL